MGTLTGSLPVQDYTVPARTLDTIIGSMERYRVKKAPMLNPLELEAPDPAEVGRAVGTRVSRFE